MTKRKARPAIRPDVGATGSSCYWIDGVRVQATRALKPAEVTAFKSMAAAVRKQLTAEAEAKRGK